jgi:hypothetical protein
MLGHYNHTLSALLDEMPLDEASKELQGMFDACVEARKRLTEHELKHGCASHPSDYRLNNPTS